MDFYGIKDAVEEIRMPEETRQRIKHDLEHRKESAVMKHQFKKPLTIAATLVLCLALPLGAAAAGKLGHFRDITNRTGAITGTVYDNAMEEIEVTVKEDDGKLLVTVRLLLPEKAPYREVEALALGSSYFTDAAGNRILELAETEAVPLSGDTVTFRLDSVAGAHTLHIENFVGSKKADQDLTISGNWEIPLN